jgi:DNA adenine methylase
VLFSKGKANDMLIEWSKKYNVNHLDYTYQNCNYHTKDKDSKPDEVLITNF